MVSREEVLDVLRNVEDPELPDQHRRSRARVQGRVQENAIEVDFTLTYPGCPAEDIIRRDIIETLRDAFGVVE